MPQDRRVELVPHNICWKEAAAAEARRLAEALGPNLIEVHHIGSTAVPGLKAKPVLDLMPVVADLRQLDQQRAALKQLGYEWRGEFGLPGRRYCPRTDPATRRRLIQLHCYEIGSLEITRHLAFRDYLRHHQDVAAQYAAEKERCRALHPDSNNAYSDCKADWILRIEAEALAWVAERG